MATLPGKFVWFEHVSAHITRARRFYEPLFGWHTEAMPAVDERYSMIINRGQGIGGYRAAAPSVRSHWIAHLSVTDVDAAFTRAIEWGARAVEPPAACGRLGRAARIVDPGGAPLALWQSAHGDRPDLAATQSGDWHWNELWTPDELTALAFYQAVFGYGHDRIALAGERPYYLLVRDGVARGGVLRATDREASALWLPYVTVDDCDATAAHAAELGAELLRAPLDTPGVGRFAVLSDPLGAAIAIIKPAPADRAGLALREATAA